MRPTHARAGGRTRTSVLGNEVERAHGDVLVVVEVLVHGVGDGVGVAGAEGADEVVVAAFATGVFGGFGVESAVATPIPAP